MTQTEPFRFQRVIQYGIICAACILYLALVGVLEAFQARNIIAGDFEEIIELLRSLNLRGFASQLATDSPVELLLPLGHGMLIAIGLMMGYTTARNVCHGQLLKSMIAGPIVTLIGGLMTALFVLLIEPWGIRTMFVNASPALIKLLTFENEQVNAGLQLLIGGFAVCGLIGAILYLLPNLLQRMIITGLLAVLIVGMLQDFVIRFTPFEGVYDVLTVESTAPAVVDTLENLVEYEEDTVKFLFNRNGLSASGALIVFLLFALFPLLRAIGDGINARTSASLKTVFNWLLVFLGILLLIAEGFLLQLVFGLVGLAVAALIGLIVIVVAVGLFRSKSKSGSSGATGAVQKGVMNWVFLAVGVNILILIPIATDSYITQILFLVGLYIAMGLGLNIELGWAGLLDLGFSGFFAIGAYTVAVLCSTGELGLYNVINGETGNSFSFWMAVPIAVVISAIAGVVLGIPVLRTRGDYLAIITLGLAEIIRILVKSNALKEFLGGPQGVLNIAKPTFFGFEESLFGLTEFVEPKHFYYVVLLFCLILGGLAWRMQFARVGRNWMALREDEDVAEAMGINLVATKLLAFGIGASFAGLSGAVFAVQLGSVFPESFGLLVSINVVSLVIIGGIGSIPGVVVGALVLVGLPELLREFSEFRMLIYGALLIVMMLVKPEGFIPSEANKRELQSDEDETEVIDASSAAVSQS